MKMLLLYILVSLSSSAFATGAKLLHFNRDSPIPYMELLLHPSGASTLDEIFKVIEFSRGNKLRVRLHGTSSEKTDQELFNYYKYNNDFPYWKNGLVKDGVTIKNDLINKIFIGALKSTTLFKELELTLLQYDFIIEDMHFEKLGYCNSNNLICIPDVWIVCNEKPGKKM